ncbi:hypothetical protein AS86_4030 [Bacillus thuringiensis HD1002]|uniref:Uncharacterized protein n=1 Tax=Bacillus thuringiensis subsp. israelensis TaxID=1430 RepID=A0AAX3HXK3_BACTI|nr:hypothetical protein AS86_4030 [Bacillus thuringiensis HD1002]RCX36387.1 hypothetical protein DEU45_12349 [Bacillus sp. AG102]TWE59897.1 hypothetical protein FHW38_12349 [Bacillus thuringiensis]TWG46392.1 hypothetical protein FHX98_5383 [Bacillus sp. AK8]VIJ07606.1 hypothetical protein BTAR23_AR23_05714 [Bacillus thuringiensis serovar israelensis]
MKAKLYEEDGLLEKIFEILNDLREQCRKQLEGL